MRQSLNLFTSGELLFQGLAGNEITSGNMVVRDAANCDNDAKILHCAWFENDCENQT